MRIANLTKAALAMLARMYAVKPVEQMPHAQQRVTYQFAPVHQVTLVILTWLVLKSKVCTAYFNIIQYIQFAFQYYYMCNLQ